MLKLHFPILLACLLIAPQAPAELYELPIGADVIGEAYIVKAGATDTLLDIARRNGMGQTEILIANPDVDRWLPGAGTEVLIPSRYVLPDAPRNGLVLNLPEMRIYHFPPPPRKTDGETPPRLITTYPVSVGRMDWKTPLGTSRIVRKQKDPSWRPPKSVIEEALAAGEEPPPKVVPPGPDNPLGQYALRLNLPGYLIHGTNKPWGVGMRVTHGCVRLLPEHIERLFAQVEVGTEVHLVNQPVKLGWLGNQLLIEVHPPLEEDAAAREDLLDYALEHVYSALEQQPARLQAGRLRSAVEQATGVPVAIATRGGTHLDNPLFRR